MRALIQKVTEASVVISNTEYSHIHQGLLVLLGIEDADDHSDIEWLTSKISQMRLFNDINDVMNLSVKEVNGEVLIVSQFTLHASTKKGNRPSYIKAARPEKAITLYEGFIFEIQKMVGKKVMTGVFGADMKVSLVNNGPVTIWLDSKNRE